MSSEREYGDRVDPTVAGLIHVAADAARRVAAAAQEAGRQYDSASLERLAEQLEQALAAAQKR